MNEWKTRFDILTALVPGAEVKWIHNGQHWRKLDSGKWMPTALLPGATAAAYECPTAHIAEWDFVGISPATGEEVTFMVENYEAPASVPAVTPLGEYARELQKIYDERTAGDYTFYGVLGAFLEAVDTARAEGEQE